MKGFIYMPKQRFNTIVNSSNNHSNSVDINVNDNIYNFKMPNLRHSAAKVNQNSTAKGITTVYEPWVNIRKDLEEINLGRALRDGEHFIVNNRVYKIHNSTIHPVSGDGFHSLDRGTYKALGVYNTFGNSQRSSSILDNMGILLESRERALNVWTLLQNTTEEG
jgi:hypothetical protein